ncbi:MAG: ATP-binding protein [candidate division Zixibacteria bacterium]|nr:ATP-binding protein [candidate division Zixibacteria bacterium]
MKRRKLFWIALPYFVVIIIVSLSLAAFYASSQMRVLYLDEISRELEARARIVGENLNLGSVPLEPDRISSQCRRLAALSDTRITVIDTSGVVLGDSDEDPRTMENHAARPEIVSALAGEVGVATRFSNTLQKTVLYVAVRVHADGRTVAVVRTSRPRTAIDLALSSFYRRLFIGGALVVLLACLVSILVLRRFTRPLRLLQAGAERIASGDLSARMPVHAAEEIGALAESMNRMAAQLDSRFQTITRQRNEREAILAGMSEGVVALDASDRVVSLNLSAAKLLNLDSEAAVGQTLFALVRIAVLHDLIAQAVEGSDVAETEFVTSGVEERHLLAHASALWDVEGKRAGVVLVLSDITRLKQLERVRQDFVANVSHELKTPITAIRGSVETLLDGALADAENGPRFLGIIDKQSARLSSLVDDLLSLARIEEQASQGAVQLTSMAVGDVLSAAVAACQEQAARKRIALGASCDPTLTAGINPRQLEQALINLISNAIQYSDDVRTVRVSAEAVGDEIRLSVADQGCGIEAKHLPRIFERFYRVDSARSRATGGTGLGLSIVKHVALAHGGRVDVTSTLGQGSTFMIAIPRRRP